MPALIVFVSGVVTCLVIVGILLGMSWWLDRDEADPAGDDKGDLGERIDLALNTYSELVDNDCHDQEILEIARNRVLQLKCEYEVQEIRKLQITHTRKNGGS
jgi:hypothetical protein